VRRIIPPNVAKMHPSGNSEVPGWKHIGSGAGGGGAGDSRDDQQHFLSDRSGVWARDAVWQHILVLHGSGRPSSRRCCARSASGGYIFWKQKQVKTHGQTNLAYDIGQTVHIVHWLDDRHARVSYRAPSGMPNCPVKLKRKQPAVWRIKDFAGSRLIIE